MTMHLLRMSSDGYSKQYGKKRTSVDFICDSCGFKLGVNYQCKACIASADPESACRSRSNSKDVAKDVLPINQLVFVRESRRAGHVIAHVRNRSQEVTNYRITFECGEFEVETEPVVKVEKHKVHKLIRQSRTPWPSRALSCRTRVHAVDGFNDSDSKFTGEGSIFGVCVDSDALPLYYEIVVSDGREFFFDVRNVSVSAPRFPFSPPQRAPGASRKLAVTYTPASMSTTPAAPTASPNPSLSSFGTLISPGSSLAIALAGLDKRSAESTASATSAQPSAVTDALSAESTPTPPAPGATSATSAPASATSAQPPAVTDARRAESTPTPPASSATSPSALAGSAPVSRTQTAAVRLRNCKDCGASFPWVARVTLCNACGVQKPRNTSQHSDSEDAESSASSSTSSDHHPVHLEGGRKRARKFTPHKNQVLDIFMVIAADCPYTHQRDSQKHCWTKALKCMHRKNLAEECTKYRQLKAWCDKICETHHRDVMANLNKSGVADVTQPTVLDTVACDWAEYNLRTGKASKINKKHAEIIRASCVTTSTTVPEFAARIASGREKHNAIARTASASQPRTSQNGTTSASPLMSPPPAQRPTRQYISDALQAITAPLPGTVPTADASVTAEFAKALVEREKQLYPENFVSRLEQYVPVIMQTLGVQCVADFDELEEGQEAACGVPSGPVPVISMNRFKKVLHSFRNPNC
jgi:hypothetical protein